MDPIFNVFDRGLKFSVPKIFVVHGHDEENLEQLELMLYRFDLKPVVMKNDHYFSSKTIIEDFERVGRECKYCIALLTPDDLVQKETKSYYQARPNVLFEIGWFCGAMSRSKVLVIVKDETTIFSDFDGVRQIKFRESVKEVYENIHSALKNQNLA